MSALGLSSLAREAEGFWGEVRLGDFRRWALRLHSRHHLNASSLVL